MHWLGHFLAVAVCFTPDEGLDIRELAVIEAFYVVLGRRAAIRVDGKNPNPERLLPTCARDPFEPRVARSPDQHEQQNSYAYIAPHDDLGAGLAHAPLLRRCSRQKPRFLPAIHGVMSEKRPQAVFPID